MAKTQKEITELVYSYETKHEIGFTDKEILYLLMKSKETINMEKFGNALTGITCTKIDDDFITYHCDIEIAMRCGIQDRDLKGYEFD